MKKKVFFSSTVNNPVINLNIVGLAIDSDSRVLLSERNECHLLRIDKYCNFIEGSDFITELSNSCGISTNGFNQIFVTDAKLNTLLKFNSHFHLLQTVIYSTLFKIEFESN
jgi:hypothetical protein